jgi:hypothetical protein
VKWLADENFRNAIIRGVVRRNPSFDILRAQDIPEISGRNDLALLGWATLQHRIVLTQDVSTMVPAMREHRRVSSRSAPIVFVPEALPIGRAVNEILLIDQCAEDADWAAGILYLPLR